MVNEIHSTAPTPRGLVSEFNRIQLMRKLDFPSMPDPLHIGSRGRYLLLQVVGAGGMGTVFKARDTLTRVDVAIKAISSRHINETTRALLLREAQLLASVRHRNVVNVHEVGEFSEREYFVVMRYVPGGTLRTWQVRDRPLEELVAVYRQAGEGLAAAHGEGVVHRDFKPDNVFIDGEGTRVIVGDFGLARPVDETGREPTTRDDASRRDFSNDTISTRISATSGTPGYIAPELRTRSGRLGDFRSDQYAFCVSLWEAVVGQRPFAVDRSEVEHVAVKPPKMPGWLYRVLRKGLSYRAHDRYPDMRALLVDLSRRKRRTQLGLALGSGAAAACLIGAVVLALQPDPCAEASQPIRDTWNEATQARVEHALLDLDLPYGQRVAAHALAVLDDAALRWRYEARVLCEAEDIAALERAQRKACLDLWHTRMSQRVDALAHAQKTSADRVLELLAPLHEAADLCDTPRPLVANEAIRHNIELSEFHESMADHERAWTYANEALTLARQNPESSVDLASSLIRHGEALARQQDYDAALAALADGASAALIGEDDLGFVDSRTLSARILAHGQGDAEGARQALADAEAMLARLGAGQRGARRAQLDKAAAQVAMIEGDYDEARRHFAAGLARLDDPDNADLLLAVELQSSIGRAYQWEANYSKASDAYALAQARIEAVLGASHPMTRKRLAQRQVCHLLMALDQGDFDEAEALAATIAAGPWPALAIKSLASELATKFQLERPQAELEVLARRLEAAIDAHPQSNLVVQAEGTAMAGQILAHDGNEEGIELLERAQALYERLGDEYNVVMVTHIRAKALCDSEQYERCEPVFARIADSEYLTSDEVGRAELAAIKAKLSAAKLKRCDPPPD